MLRICFPDTTSSQIFFKKAWPAGARCLKTPSAEPAVSQSSSGFCFRGLLRRKTVGGMRLMLHFPTHSIRPQRPYLMLWGLKTYDILCHVPEPPRKLPFSITCTAAVPPRTVPWWGGCLILSFRSYYVESESPSCPAVVSKFVRRRETIASYCCRLRSILAEECENFPVCSSRQREESLRAVRKSILEEWDQRFFARF